MCDFTYIENVAHAHICAEEALCSRTVFVSGKGIALVTSLAADLFAILILLLLILGLFLGILHR